MSTGGAQPPRETWGRWVERRAPAVVVPVATFFAQGSAGPIAFNALTWTGMPQTMAYYTVGQMWNSGVIYYVGPAVGGAAGLAAAAIPPAARWAYNRIPSRRPAAREEDLTQGLPDHIQQLWGATFPIQSPERFLPILGRTWEDGGRSAVLEPPRLRRVQSL